MVIANNVICLREIQRRLIEDNQQFRGINAISLSTIDRILRKHRFRMKQAYCVPFERNSVKDQHLEYVQVRVCTVNCRKYFVLSQYNCKLQISTWWSAICTLCFRVVILYCVYSNVFCREYLRFRPAPHEIIFVDEAGFNLTKRRRRGRNIIGHRPIVNVSFHHSALVRDWFTNNPRFLNIFLPAYSPFPNRGGGFFLHGGEKYMTKNLTSVIYNLLPFFVVLF